MPVSNNIVIQEVSNFNAIKDLYINPTTMELTGDYFFAILVAPIYASETTPNGIGKNKTDFIFSVLKADGTLNDFYKGFFLAVWLVPIEYDDYPPFTQRDSATVAGTKELVITPHMPRAADLLRSVDDIPIYNHLIMSWIMNNLQGHARDYSNVDFDIISKWATTVVMRSFITNLSDVESYNAWETSHTHATDKFGNLDFDSGEIMLAGHNSSLSNIEILSKRVSICLVKDNAFVYNVEDPLVNMKSILANVDSAFKKNSPLLKGDMTRLAFDNIVNPVIKPGVDILLIGETSVGSTLTLTLTKINSPRGTANYVWLRDGITIADANQKTYVTVVADLNHKISVLVHGFSSDIGTIGAKTSNEITIISSSSSG